MNKIEMLASLLRNYELAKLGRERNEQRINEASNKVLKENIFVADMDCERIGIKKGDRITDEEMTFLMEKKQWNKYIKLHVKECEKRGLTDKDGKIIGNWPEMVAITRKMAVDYILRWIVPDDLKEKLSKVRNNVIMEKKLIEIYAKQFKK